MRTYPKNSPEALARVVAMAMLTDADLGDREVEMLDQLQVLKRIGISRARFIRVVRDYFKDILEEDTRDNRVRMVEAKRVDEVLDCVDEKDKQAQLAAIMISLARADGMNDTELALFRHALRHWGLDVDDIPASLPRV